VASIPNPLLLDFPDHFETERLLIRAPRAGDGAQVHEAMVESFDQLHRWLPWARTLKTLAETEQMIHRMAARFLLREDFTLLLFRKTDERFIGSSGLHQVSWEVPRFEIGYWIRTSFQGQGYVTEAVSGITAFAFTVFSAERIEIRCDPCNRRSVAVAERTDYTFEGRCRNEHRDHDGELHDTLIYSKLRSEYLAHSLHGSDSSA
jgi:RimJ/RimL family protein N-acetyltransferase